MKNKEYLDTYTLELLPAVRIYHIDKIIFFVPIVLLAHDVGEVDEGQHHPLLLHLRLLGDPEVVVAAHTQARLPQEPKEEENHLISTINILEIAKKKITSGTMSSALPSTGVSLWWLVSLTFTIVNRSQYLVIVIMLVIMMSKSLCTVTMVVTMILAVI